MKHYLGIDLGTTGIKAVVFDDSGREITSAGRSTPVVSPQPGYMEVDMRRVWELVLACCKEALGSFGVGKNIAGVGITGMGGGLWLVDEDGDPVAPAVLWNDGRAAEQMGKWQREGLMTDIFQVSGNAVMPGWTVPLLRWFDDNQPHVFHDAAYVLLPKDWLRLCLTGDVGTDWSDASYVPFDINNRTWSQELMRLAEIEHLSSLLPPVRASGRQAGAIREVIRLELGLPKGCVVVTGLVDVAASTHGAGAVSPGQACTIIGTACLNSMLYSEASMEPMGVGQMLASVDDVWIRSLVNTAGTPNIDWIARLLYGVADTQAFVALEEEASQAPPGSRGLIFHPYMSSAGINAPFLHAAARGNLFALTAEHSRSDVVRAIFEGLTLSILDCYSAMANKPKEVILAGGGNRSKLLCQMITDTLEVPTVVPDGKELGARGAAMLAAVASGQYDDLESAADFWVRTAKRYEPTELGKPLREMFPVYQKIAHDLSPLWWDHQELVRNSQNMF